MTELDGLGYRDATVVVVGCASGIGEATARILGELGARVHAVSLHRPVGSPRDVSTRPTSAVSTRSTPTVDALHDDRSDRPPLLRVRYPGDARLPGDPPGELRRRAPPRRAARSRACTTAARVGIVASNVARGWEQRLPMVLEILDLDRSRRGHGVVRRARRRGRPTATGCRSSCSSRGWRGVAPVLATTRRIRINCTAPGVTDTALVEETKQYMPDGFFDTLPVPAVRPRRDVRSNRRGRSCC